MAARKDWDAVEALFEYGLDAKNRRVFLFSDVDESPIGNAVKGLYFLNGESERDPIELFVGSFGGSLYEMFGLYDVLNSIDAPIHTVAMGKCMSAAPLLVSAGLKGHRYSMPNTQWMLHMSNDEIDRDRIDHIEALVKHDRDIQQRWCRLLARHTNKSPSQWMAICRRVGDKYFDSEQAIEWGLADTIWDQKGVSDG